MRGRERQFKKIEVRDSDGGQRRQRGGHRAEGKGCKCRQNSHNPDLQGLGSPRACCKSASSLYSPTPIKAVVGRPSHSVSESNQDAKVFW